MAMFRIIAALATLAALGPWAGPRLAVAKRSDVRQATNSSQASAAEGLHADEGLNAHAFVLKTVRRTEAKNTDRIQCLRDDNLDLVIPTNPRHAIRAVVGVNEQDAASDIYISVDNVQVTRLEMYLEIKRTATNGFSVDIYGTEATDVPADGNVCAGIDFTLTGTKLLLRNSWFQLGASALTNQQSLAESQSGSLRLKLHGEGEAFLNSETGRRELRLMKKQSFPFQLKIQNQFIVEKALGYASLGDKIMSSLWPEIEKLIPNSWATSLDELKQDELDTTLIAVIKGSQKEGSSELKLHVSSKITFYTEPARLLTVLLKLYDPAKIAEEQLAALLDRQNLEELWNNNKAMFAATIKRYGVSPDFLDEEDFFNPVLLKERLMTAAKLGADTLVKGLKPFMKEGVRTRDLNAFEGFINAFKADIKWDAAKDDGKLRVVISAPEEDEGKGEPTIWVIPKNFLLVLADGMGDVGDTLVCPPMGMPEMSITSQGLSFHKGELALKRLQIQNMRLKLGDSSQKKQTWKFGGAVKDVSVKLPQSMRPGWKVDFAEGAVKLADNGDITVEHKGGLQIKEAPETMDVQPQQSEATPAKPRKGTKDDLDGPVPAEFQHPTEESPVLDPKKAAPQMDAESGVSIRGESAHLSISVSAVVKEVTLDIKDVLRYFAAGRPKLDHGYPFFHAQLRRECKECEEEIPGTSLVHAVVNCGYLRVYRPDKFDDPEKPFGSITFEATSGQLELDLSQYKVRPLVEPQGEDFCMHIYSVGMPPRVFKSGSKFWKTTKTVSDDKLCGGRAQVEKLAEAIHSQVERFRGPKAQEWNFGTHAHQEADGTDIPQHDLAPGRQTRPLDRIMGLERKTK